MGFVDIGWVLELEVKWRGLFASIIEFWVPGFVEYLVGVGV